jgi:hypothetical protein
MRSRSPRPTLSCHLHVGLVLKNKPLLWLAFSSHKILATAQKLGCGRRHHHHHQAVVSLCVCVHLIRNLGWSWSWSWHRQETQQHHTHLEKEVHIYRNWRHISCIQSFKDTKQSRKTMDDVTYYQPPEYSPVSEI